MQHLHAWSMAAAFMVWRDAAAQALAAAAALQKALAFWADRTLAAAFLGWHGHTVQMLNAEDRAAGATCQPPQNNIKAACAAGHEAALLSNVQGIMRSDV